jgi:hypothetical protein
VQEGTTNEQRLDQAQDSLYGLEHFGAWFMAAVAIVLGAVGALVGFGIFNLRAEATELIPGFEAVGVLDNNFWDATMLIFAGITAAMLAYTLHASDHHRARDLSRVKTSERSLWSGEHMAAYVMAIGALALIVIGLLTGFNAFGAANTQFDGLIWIWLGFGASILTATLHTVRHHQTVEEDQLIEAVVAELNRGGTTTRPVTGETEPRRVR